MATNDRPKLICQYWSPEEPVQCKHWNDSSTYCTFEEDVKLSDGTTVPKKAPLYPTCNFIGTAKYTCTKYEGENTKGRCILPDRTRSTPHSENCMWTTVTGTLDISDGGPSHVPLIDYEKINKYNDGLCNSGSKGTAGVNPECRGYSPQHMALGRRAVLCKDAVKTEYNPEAPMDTATADIPLEAPMGYKVLNMRAVLGKCWWWSDYSTNFTISVEGIMEPPTFACTNSDSSTVDKYKNFFIDTELESFVPPCNGAKPDCPHYTGNMMSPSSATTYLSDRQLRSGDKILAEQLLELRYNIKKQTWDTRNYDAAFGKDKDIYTYTGDRPDITYSPDGGVLDYKIESKRVYIDNFDCFSIAKEKTTLTKGNPSDDSKTDFPTLIKSLKGAATQPIIMSEFENYLFETADQNHKKIFITGSIAGLNTGIFAINLSDPSIPFPFSVIKTKDSMEEVRQSLSEDKYLKLFDHLDCYFGFLFDYGSHKIFNNEFLDDNFAFGMGVDTFFGDNEIIVFDRNTWSFDKIEIKKVFCGGVVAQTEFEVTGSGDSGTVYFGGAGDQASDLTSLGAKIKFKYEPFGTKHGGDTSIIDRFYIDTNIKVLDVNPLIPSLTQTYDLGYKEYKVTALMHKLIDGCDIKLLGNDGTMLIIIQDDAILHRTIKPWELEDDMILIGNDIKGDSHEIEMKLVKYCTDDMEVNQAIIKPKNISKYRRLYDMVIDLTEVYIFERYSFGELPLGYAYEETLVNSEFVTYNTVSTAISGGPVGDVELTTVPSMPIIMSAVFKGSVSGRVRGQTKSDLIVWAKSVVCSDVEIKYSWSANYNGNTWQPEHYLYAENIGTIDAGSTTFSYEPWCGDHYFNFTTGEIRKPMWYPYDACYNTVPYEINLPTGETDIWLMELFEGTSYEAGNIRMMGPAASIGLATDYHTHIWQCSSDWSYTNYSKEGNSWFTGYAKLRGNIDYEEMNRITNNGGFPPMFGNPVRDIYKSIRSSACVYYYNISEDGGVSRGKKWMPKNESFSLTTLDSKFTSFPFNYNFNIEDDISTFFDQFGNFIVEGSIDNVDIGEYLLTGDDNLARYKFDEVFRPHSTNIAIEYPKPKNTYVIGLDQKPIIPWYTYKDSPIGGQAIQWAWRERWKDLDRPSRDVSVELSSLDLESCKPAVSDHGLLYVDTFHPSYAYDYTAAEKQRVCDEGQYELKWLVSKRIAPGDDDPETRGDYYFILRLGDGPIVLLDYTMTLITDYTLIDEGALFKGISYDELVIHVKFASYCTGSDWFSDVTCETDVDNSEEEVDSSDFYLVDDSIEAVDDEEQAKTNAEEEDRMLTYYDVDGESVIKYYNTGIVGRLDRNKLAFAPKKFEAYDESFEYSFSRDSDDILTEEFNPREFYAGMSYNIIFSASGGDNSEMILRFEPPVSLGRFKLTFEVTELYPAHSASAEYFDNNFKEEFTSKATQINVPHVDIYIKVDESYMLFGSSSWESALKYNVVGEVRATTHSVPIEITMDTTNFEMMNNWVNDYKFVFRTIPTEEEKDLAVEELKDETLASNRKIHPTYTMEETEEDLYRTFNYREHAMKLTGLSIETVEYIDTDETIETFERKYHISVGGYGDFPVHGYDDTGSLLYADFYEWSTVYQQDTVAGILGMPDSDTPHSTISKLRGRHSGEIIIDGQSLDGTLNELEKKQEEIFNNMVDKGSETIVLKSVLHDVMRDTAEQVGITKIPTWDCTLKNSALKPLRPVKSYTEMIPEGHVWFPDPETFETRTCNRMEKTYFRYGWTRIAGGVVFKSLDSFQVYSLTKGDPEAMLEQKLDIMISGEYYA